MESSHVARQYIAKGIGYIAIIAIVTLAGIVIIMDIVKYVFGIDAVRRERDQIRRGRALLERRNQDQQKARRSQRLNKLVFETV
jgi:hypothetical protein